MPKKKPPPPPDPERFEEAVEAWRRRVPITENQWQKLTEEERQHAFTVAGVSQAKVVQHVWDAIDRAVADGTTLEDFQAQVGDELAEAWGGEDAPRTETIFRTGVMQSYNEGRQAIFSDPAVRAARPFTRFDAVDDARLDECKICKPLDGIVMPADHPFWAAHQPPLHPNCRCIHTALDPEEADETGIADEPPESEDPPEGFGKPVDFTPDLSAFSPEIAKALADKLG